MLSSLYGKPNLGLVLSLGYSLPSPVGMKWYEQRSSSVLPLYVSFTALRLKSQKSHEIVTPRRKRDGKIRKKSKDRLWAKYTEPSLNLVRTIRAAFSGSVKGTLT